MSDSTASLRRKIKSAGDLQSVVRTMKTLAASSIGQYEKSVRALGDYYRTVELGLGACFRGSEPAALMMEPKRQARSFVRKMVAPGVPATTSVLELLKRYVNQLVVNSNFARHLAVMSPEPLPA